jgi:hypothetical protein
MVRIVTSVSQVIDNLKRFNLEADKFAGLMPYYRSWYALRTDNTWLLGPSKYIGYNVSPEEYLRSPYSTQKHGRLNQPHTLDGRVTEGVLKRWSELVEEGHPNYNDLHIALRELCARYGKRPNTLARISIVQSKREEAAMPKFDDELVSLMVGVYRRLTPAQKSAFRKQVV